MPGLKISDADRQRINPRFFCSKCDLLLREPMQTSCGHLMCQSCMENMFSLPNPTCPSDEEDVLRREDVFLDKCIRRELMRLTIDCPNEGCDSSELTYEQFQEHITRCVEARERNVPNARQVEGLRAQGNDENE